MTSRDDAAEHSQEASLLRGTLKDPWTTTTRTLFKMVLIFILLPKMSCDGPTESVENPIVAALAATRPQDIEAVASILKCKRKASSPSIYEPCLSVPSILIDETIIFQQESILSRLILCPSIYDIPWRAVVAAIRYHAASSDSGRLDLDVHAFLRHVATVWRSKGKHQSLSSPSKRLRTGETATKGTPAKWLLRMADAVLERTHQGYHHRQEEKSFEPIDPERLKDLLSILSSVILLASEFESNLSREILDRAFIRKVIRPECGHLMLLHLASDVGSLLRPADWRGLQSTLQMEAALFALDTFPDSDLADIVGCIIQTGVDASHAETAAGRKLLRRWVNIFLLSLRDCGGKLFVNEVITATFGTLEIKPFNCWLDQLLNADVTNDPQSFLVVHGLLLMAQSLEGRHETTDWKASAFWGKVLAAASWGAESIELKSVTHISKGHFKGSSSMDRLGKIVYKSIRTSERAFNEQNGRCWVRFMVDALLLEKETLKILPAATIIATLVDECHSLCGEIFDQLMKHGTKSPCVANVLAAAMSILGNSPASFFALKENLVNLLSLPISLKMFDSLSSKCSKIEALQTNMFQFVKDRLGALYILERGIDNDSSDPSIQAKRCLLLIINLFETQGCVEMCNARNLLSRVIVSNNPPIPFEARTWLYDYLYERTRSGTVTQHACTLCLRTGLLRALSFLNDTGEEFRFDLAVRRRDGGVLHEEDLPGLFKLLLAFFRSVEPKSFRELRRVIAWNLCNGERKGYSMGKGDTKSVFYRPMLVCLSLTMLRNSMEVKFDVAKAIAKLRQGGPEEHDLPVVMAARTNRSGVILPSPEACDIARETIKLHCLLQLYLVDQYFGNDPTSRSTSTIEDLDDYLLAVARCFNEQLRGSRTWLFDQRTAALIAASSDGFCELLLSSFNKFLNEPSKAFELDVILAATALFCEVSTCVTIQSQSPTNTIESLSQVPLLWAVYRLIAEEKKARMLIASLEKYCIGDRQSSWGKDQTIDDSIRQVRAGVLQLLRSRMRIAVSESASIVDPTEHNEPLILVQKVIKRLCKNLVAAQEGQSGGLSHDLFGNFLDCIDLGLEILDAMVKKGFRGFTDDLSTFCASQMKTVLMKFPAQRQVNLKKLLNIWLWRAPKLNMSLCLELLQSTKQSAEFVFSGQDDDAINQCFAELHSVVKRKNNASTGTSLTLPHDPKEGVAAIGETKIFSFPSEKKWAGAYSAVVQITRKHWNECTKQMTEDNPRVCTSIEGLDACFRLHSSKLRFCLGGIERSLCAFGSELAVVHLPYSVKTDISHACDAFLSSLLLALAFLKNGIRKTIDEERFEAAASCIYAWAQPSRDDLPCVILRWQRAEATIQTTCPELTSDALLRRLKKMTSKVRDLAKILEQVVSSEVCPQFIDRLDDLVRDKNSASKEDEVSVIDMIFQKHKIVEKTINSSLTLTVHKKRKREKKTRQNEAKHASSIVGKWQDIERDEGHKISKDEDFEDLNDFLVDG